MDKSESRNIGVPFEEALDKTGNGIYNVTLAATCSLLLLAIGVDMFGFSLVAAVACDMGLTVSQKGVLTSLPYTSILFVSFVWGYVSDTRGRRRSLALSMQAGFVLSCLSSLSPNWVVLGVIKFLSVCFSCAANSITYTLVGESCPQAVRSKYMLLMTCLLLFSPAAAVVMSYPVLKMDFAYELPWLGITFTPWRLLLIIQVIPSGLGAVAIYFFHESPKFLANRGQNDEALEVLRDIYSFNNKQPRENFEIQSIILEEEVAKQSTSLLHSVLEQSAPLFRPPLVWRTLQLFYIVSVVYMTNNSFLVWLTYILNLVWKNLESGTTSGNICELITLSGNVSSSEETPAACVPTIQSSHVVTLLAAQSSFTILNFIISQLPNHRKTVLIVVSCVSALSGVCLNLTPEPLSSLFIFVVFTCTNLNMGILASYFVDLYPTSYRGMAACLSIMVGRTSTFIGINLVGNIIFSHCRITFYLWSIFVLSSGIAGLFLPPDKPRVEAASTKV